MRMGEKDICDYVDTFMMSAYANMLKSLQAFSCFSRMSIQIRHPKNDGLALFIIHWLMLFKDTSVNTSILRMYSIVARVTQMFLSKLIQAILTNARALEYLRWIIFILLFEKETLNSQEK